MNVDDAGLIGDMVLEENEEYDLVYDEMEQEGEEEEPEGEENEARREWGKLRKKRRS